MAADDGSVAAAPGELRRLVAEVLAEVLQAGSVPAASAVPSLIPSGVPSGAPVGSWPRRSAPPGEIPAGVSGDPGSLTVSLNSDDELHAFVLRVLRLGDNPGLRPSGPSRLPRRPAPGWCSGAGRC